MDDFYEDDEPVKKIVAAFDAGAKGHTRPPPLGEIVSARVPGPLAAEIRQAASARGMTMSEMLREGARRMLPAGYQCQHASVTAGGGTLSRVAVGCGCTMQPIYA